MQACSLCVKCVDTVFAAHLEIHAWSVGPNRMGLPDVSWHSLWAGLNSMMTVMYTTEMAADDKEQWFESTVASKVKRFVPKRFSIKPGRTVPSGSNPDMKQLICEFYFHKDVGNQTKGRSNFMCLKSVTLK